MSTTGAFKVTYATISANNEELHSAFDRAIAQVTARHGATWPIYIGGEARTGSATFADTSPIDTRIVLGHFQSGTRQDAADAVAAARAAYPGWRTVPYQERCRIMLRAADLISEHVYELSALMTFEMGKSRIEALGDVEESADLLRYYAHQMEANNGYSHPLEKLSPSEHTFDVLRPYGVWAVLSPFNFPLALAAGPVAAALITGNTVVLKPSSETPWMGLRFYEILIEAGVPAGAINVITGPGSVVGAALYEHDGVDGITFTGSYEVGFNGVQKHFGKHFPKPAITEMGGKNAAIVTAHADLDRAATGVMRSAFGMGGQKCSACSRVYVDRRVKDEFLAKLLERTRAIKIGNPLERDVFLGPVVHRQAYEDFQRYAAQARKHGQILCGGEVIADGALARGYFAQPTIFTGVPESHPLVQDELFVPILYVGDADSLDDALDKANAVRYGLTAGLYSREQEDIDRFLDRVEAGVVYVNREAGATTGAWPGVQPFGGWKASGSTGKNIGGMYTLPCYMREQSRTIVD